MARNKQAERSRDYMIQALFLLMDKHRFEDIKISEITEKAGVARLTFYRHFETKEDIIQAHLDDEFESYINESFFEENTDLFVALRGSFDYWKRDEIAIKLIIEQNLSHLIFKTFNKFLHHVLNKTILPRNLSHFETIFIEGGLLLCMVDWIADGKGKTSADMANIILDVISLNR